MRSAASETRKLLRGKLGGTVQDERISDQVATTHSRGQERGTREFVTGFAIGNFPKKGRIRLNAATDD